MVEPATEGARGQESLEYSPEEAPASAAEPQSSQDALDEERRDDRRSKADADERPLDEPRSLSEAQAQLAKAERSLALLLAPEKGAERSRRAGASSGAPAPKSAPKKKEASGGDCRQVCRAFSSLLRATASICRMDGEAGAHCTHAKKTVDRYRPSVMNCGC
jgi:hypothetical protein